MKRFAFALALIVFTMSMSVRAQSATSNETIGQIVKELAEAYEAKDLGKLDSEPKYFGRVKVIIQHSLAEGKGEFEIKWVSSLAKAEAWLKSRETDGFPAREVRPLIKCAKGSCTYDFDGGILHNHLYLKKVTYGFRKGHPYIKTILLLDGD